jgi:Na+-transporting methylmalonyl-CoA/oxaloacetate decarboxylase gamma subunit
MDGQPDWAEAFKIMITGFGAVFLIMVLLAVITQIVGKIVQHFEKPKEDKGKNAP